MHLTIHVILKVNVKFKKQTLFKFELIISYIF